LLHLMRGLEFKMLWLLYLMLGGLFQGVEIL
jgi:hypothetical protein